MKKIASFILAVITPFLILSQQSMLEHISQVNSLWLSSEAKPFISSSQFHLQVNQNPIQQHLYNVIRFLKSKDISHLNEAQTKTRTRLIDTLENYTNRGVFPVNKLHFNRQPYFIDEFGTYCAVGYLMKQSGYDDMAKEINKHQSYHFLENIEHPNLMEWVYQSGFTFDEIAFIQPFYGGWGTEFTELHFNNTGTDVNEYIEIHDASPGFLGLRFDSVYFYDNTNFLYKTLAKNQMSQMVLDPYFYYYTFPASESFANEGKVELIYHDDLNNRYIIKSLEYTNNQIAVTQSFGGTTTTFPISENETTPVGTSLSFCGNPFVDYHPELIPSTIGTIQGCLQNIAPIDITQFTHRLEDNRIQLSWQIPDYHNTSQVSVECSGDGYNFNVISSTIAPFSQPKFQFTDVNPNYYNHYRIKLVSSNNEVRYSKIMFVKMSTKNPIVVQPLVASNSISISIKKPLAELTYLHIYTTQGQLVKQTKLQSNNIAIPIQHLSQGKYIIRLGTHENMIYTSTFIKN